jgi:pimeloyl-ACP methyl ester carboxylesterase
LHFPGPRRIHREIFRDRARSARARFAVAILDWRGQGGSERALSDPFKGHVRNFQDYETDVEVFMREVVLPDCPPPHYAIAHSMGASVMLRMSYKGQALVRPYRDVGADDRHCREKPIRVSRSR